MAQDRYNEERRHSNDVSNSVGAIDGERDVEADSEHDHAVAEIESEYGGYGARNHVRADSRDVTHHQSVAETEGAYGTLFSSQSSGAAMAAQPGRQTASGSPVKGPKTGKVDNGLIDAYYLTEFNSVYNRAVKAWTDIATKQEHAINSIYTEAKKPTKPDLAEEILLSLALAALGGTVNVIGVRIARTVQDKVAKSLSSHIVFDARMTGGGRWVRTFPSGSQGRIISGDQAAAIKGTASVTASYIAEFGKDAFKDGIKSLTGPAIRDLLKSGKLPIDAFFEGSMSAAIDSGREASDALETKRTDTLASAGDPLLAATAYAEAADEHYKEAETVQKDETLKAWLQYQARSEMGQVRVGPGAEEVTAVGGKLPGQLGGMVPDGLAGVLTIDVYPGARMEQKIMGAALPGLSRAMLTQLQDKRLKDLGLPIVFRVAADAHSYARAMRGLAIPAGRPGRGPGAVDESQFSIRVDEAGRVFADARHAHHKELLARWVGGDPKSSAEVQRGAESIAYMTWVLTLKDLAIAPDKE